MTEKEQEENVSLIVNEDTEEEVEDEEEEAEPAKEYIKPEQVFKKPRKIKKPPEPPKEPEEEEEEPAESKPKKEVPSIVPALQKVKNQPRKKRVMTPEMLEKLAMAREKAKEARIKRNELKKEGKPIPKTRKQMRKEKLQKEIEDLRPVHITNETKNITNNFTEEDIARISAIGTQKALQKYEEDRQARKAEKRKKKEEEEAQRLFNEKISRAAEPKITKREVYKLSDPDFWENAW